MTFKLTCSLPCTMQNGDKLTVATADAVFDQFRLSSNAAVERVAGMATHVGTVLAVIDLVCGWVGGWVCRCVPGE